MIAKNLPSSLRLLQPFCVLFNAKRYFINKQKNNMADMINQQRVFEMLPISKEQRLALIEALVKEHEEDDLNSERKETCNDDTKTCNHELADQVDSLI